jgi:hypothetical protein
VTADCGPGASGENTLLGAQSELQLACMVVDEAVPFGPGGAGTCPLAASLAGRAGAA